MITCWKRTMPLSFVKEKQMYCENYFCVNFFKEKQLCCENSFYVIYLKRNNLCCENSFCFLVKEWFILQIFVASLMNILWKLTVPLSFICVMGDGPMNYNLCLEFFFCLTRILSPTLYWWLFRRMFLRLLLWFIRNCLRCRMCFQSATWLMFKMASQPNNSCVEDACSVVW